MLWFKMNKKICIGLSLVFFLLISFTLATAVPPDADSTVAYFGFDTLVIGANDYTPNNNDGTVNGATWNSSGIYEGAYSYDGVNDYISIPKNFSTMLNNDNTVSGWFYVNTFPSGADTDYIISFRGERNYNIRLNSENRLEWTAYTGSTEIKITSSILNINEWYFFTAVRDTTNGMSLYVNAQTPTTNAYTGVFATSSLTRNALAELGNGALFFNGSIDEIAVFNYSLSSNEIEYLYNNGNPTKAQQYPFSSEINDSTESTFVARQQGTTSFGSGMTTIFSGSFNVSVNNTPVYGGYVFNVESNNANTIYCELVIDEVVVANITRSQNANVLGSAFIQSPLFLTENGTHTQRLQCQRQSGASLVTVSNAVGVGHFLVNQDQEIIPYNFTEYSESVTSASSYTLIDSYDITIGNKTEVDETQNRTNHIVIESKATYTNNGANEVLGMYIDVNGTICPSYPRYVGSGSTGSVSMDCIISNVTQNATYTVNIYGNGTNALYEGNSIAKNFFLSASEIVGGTGVLAGYSFSGSDWTTVFESTGGNLNHDEANAFVKLAYSITTDINTQVDFYITIANGDTFTTDTWSRDYIAGQTGVIIGQDVIENLPQDPNYNITLFARCGVGATCTIDGGSSLGYVTDITTTTINGFNVSVFDVWDNASVLNFSVVDGGTWTTTTGSVIVFSEDDFINLTVSSDEYFSTSVLNHNTSENLNVTLRQTDIKFLAYELGSNDSLDNATFTIDGITKNANESFYLSAGTYTVTATNTGYYSRSKDITVEALDNRTIEFTGNDALADSLFVITARDFIDDSIVTNFTAYFYSDEDYDYSTSQTTTNGTVYFYGIQNDAYLLNISADGYATTIGYELTNTNNLTAYNITLFAFNSVLFNIYDANTFNLITDQVNLTFIYDNVNFKNSTTTGSLFVDLLIPEDYEVIFESAGYNTVSRFFSVSNDSTQTVNVYLDYNTTVSQRFRVVDTANTPITGAYIRIQKQVLEEDENFVTVQEVITDENGYGFGLIEKAIDVFYRFSVVVDGEVKPLSPSGDFVTSKQSFLTTLDETVQLVVNLETESSSLIDQLSSISYALTLSGDDNELVNFWFIDGRNSIVGGRLVITYQLLNESLNEITLFDETINDFDGEFNAVLSVVNNTKYTIKAYILFENSVFLVDERVVVYDGDVFVNKGTGLLLAVIIMLFVMFATIMLRPLLSSILTFGILYPLTLFHIISFPVMIITSLIALAIILFVRKGGQN